MRSTILRNSCALRKAISFCGSAAPERQRLERGWGSGVLVSSVTRRFEMRACSAKSMRELGGRFGLP